MVATVGAIALKSLGLSALIGTTIGSAAVQLLGGVAILALQGGLRRRNHGGQTSTRQSLAFPTELMAKRFVYGRDFAQGTPFPHTTKNGKQYMVCLLNSRPSKGNFELYLDNRAVTYTGDPYDMDGPGAVADNGLLAGHARFWFAMGDQTRVPQQFLDDVPYDADDRPFGFRATDVGRGQTLVWLILTRGDEGALAKRWPGYPSSSVKVLGDWSKVYDPRDPEQDFNDPTTHTHSANQTLCLFDLLTRNPFRPYGLEDFNVSAWSAGADVADRDSPLKSGGTEPLYTVSGTVAFNGPELEQLAEPLEMAGAGEIARLSGRLSYIPGVPLDTTVTISEMEELPSISMVPPEGDIFDEVSCSYAPLERLGEPASLKTWAIPGVEAKGLPRVLAMDLEMVKSPYQGMRIRKIVGLQTLYTRRMQGVAFADAVVCVPGSWIKTALPFEQMNGIFKVASVTPLAAPLGEDGGVAMRVPLVLRETNRAIYEWDPLVDEEDVNHPVYTYDDERLAPPGVISVETGEAANLNSGNTIIPRARFSFAPSPDPVETYQWQFAVQGEAYGDLFSIAGDTLDASGKVFGFMVGEADVKHDIRVRSVDLTGTSDWVEITGVTPIVAITLDLPIMAAPVETSPGEVTLSVTLPNDPNVRGVEVFGGPDADPANAAIIGTVIYASQNATVTVIDAGLGSGVTRFYFSRSRGDFALISAFTAGQSITTA